MHLKRTRVKELLDDVLRCLPHEECETCECLHGLITQLELDAQDDVSDLIETLKVPKQQMHDCLGCSPCLPSDAFANYIRCR